MPDWSIKLHNGMQSFTPTEWDTCAGADNPFISHAFLSALEESQSVSARTGWLAQHVSLHAPDGTLAAVCPAYLKGHSWGEYVFDQGWARALEAAGGSYYPKLQIAVPFTPAPGPRLLVHPNAPPETATVLADALRQICGQLQLSSAHVTFCTTQNSTTLSQRGWLPRLGIQYHWHNNGYQTFDDFLAALSSRKRKVLKRERRDANAAGLTFETLRGADITPADWDAFYQFYQNTIDRKWGSAYLTRSFFSLLSEKLGERVVLMVARHGHQPVAAALNLVGTDTLYGRNWGCVGTWPFLHFELCYYRAIEFAIANGLKRVEAGAQGEHKIQRGYTPSLTHSAHWIENPSFRTSVAAFLEQERTAIQQEAQTLTALSPYKQELE
ncbi:GNAT family N-acetyltransferase [Acetobacter orientalis]|uniref:GNAT family N-acetyltransferase n=1 Tax=Acetobacter orientalis TaxID=146474 RepID=UPI00209D8EEF|nr:GNAT family N-acetyltransferase [Acetobacter orientalis]MCP1216220.1 GNAT family N-acetyltransferase [Acetobacter orientalis]MCP1219109.1 GNAT family N-acetyltransferase [Acetobacter orientalis]